MKMISKNAKKIYAYLDAKIGVDTKENGPSKLWGPKCGFGSWYM